MDSILTLLAAVCQQGLAKSYQTYSSRWFYIVMLIFGFLIYQFYSASIVSALLMEKPKTIKTLRNLIDSPLELYIDNTLYMKNYFTRTTDPESIELYNKKIVVFNKITKENELHYTNLDEGLKLIKNGPFAFHIQDNMAYRVIANTFTETQICDMSEIEMMQPQHMQLVVRKLSPFRKIMTLSFRKINEYGLMARERQFWKTPIPKCVRIIKPEDIQVRIEYIYSVLMFLTVGYVTSFGILLLELFHVKFCNNKHICL
uniref:CSON013544 protein n=1 Tax=Culicoides sonorensis TaxID=179676 RepID=A0A336MC91_CULSO